MAAWPRARSRLGYNPGRIAWGAAMDALMSSAQSWVPWVGVAGLLLCKSWIAALGVSRRPAFRAALGGFFISLGLGAVVPASACVFAWALHGGIASLGGLVLLTEPASSAQQLQVLAWLAAPSIIFLAARYLFGSADAIAYAVAGAAAIAFCAALGPLAAFAAALAVGGIVSFAAGELGEAATGLAASTAFVLIFAFAYGGGGQAVALLALSMIVGTALALIAAGGKRARLPVFVILPLIPALALAYWDGASASFDLSRTLPAPATGNAGALVFVFAVLPALIAPFAWPPMLIARQPARFEARVPRLVSEPIAIVIEAPLGVALAILAALALTAGAALYSRFHELGGGARLLSAESILRAVSPAPFAPGEWWLTALLVLPLAPAAAHIFLFITRLWLRLVDTSGLGPWLEDAIRAGALVERFTLTLVKRVMQMMPGVLLVLLVLEFVSPIVAHGRARAAPIGGQLISLCAEISRGVDALAGR